jgi:hypothetical protein
VLANSTFELVVAVYSFKMLIFELPLGKGKKGVEQLNSKNIPVLPGGTLRCISSI